MTRLLFLGMIFTGLLSAQSASPEKWSTFKRVCGRVVRDTSHNENTQQLKGVSGAIVQLYRWSENSTCCDEPTLVETKTGHAGKFKDVVPGTYWLLVHVQGRLYTMKVRNTPGYSDDFGPCSDHLFTVERSGDFVMERNVRVD